MSDMKIFDTVEFGFVRIHVDAEGEPWFVAKDVAAALEYTEASLANIPAVISHVPEKWRGRNSFSTLGGSQELLTLSEQGLYFFLGRSNKPKALPFQEWLAGEVLPSIRRTGKYETTPALPQDYLSALKALVASLERGDRLEEEKLELREQRDYFKRTKAEIGSRREATAMNTASRLSKENAKLKDDAGIGKTWKTAKAIEWIEDVFVPSPGMWSQLGKKLSALSLEMGYEVRRLQTPEYPNGVGLYHVAVVDMLKLRIETHPEMLWRYRREEAA